MADFFTHFSCLLDVGTPDNAARALDLYLAFMAEAAREDVPPDGFLLSIQPEYGGTALWIRDDVTGDPQQVILFVLRCAEAFGLTAAGASSGPTPARGRASTPSAAARMCSISRPARRSPGSTPTAGWREPCRPVAGNAVRHERHERNIRTAGARRDAAVSRPSSAFPCKFAQSVCKAPVQLRKRGTVRFAPAGQHPRQKPAARPRDCSHDLPAIVRQLCRPSAPVCLSLASRNQRQAFKLGELAAHGRVVASYPIGQLRDAQRTARAQRHQQREQGAVETDTGLTQQRLVALRAVQEPDEIDHRAAQSFQIACIMHLYVASRTHHVMCMIHAYTILVIAGSTRARRLCPQIAEWVAEVGRETIPAQFEVIDLKDWALPLDDEPAIPAVGDYTFEHTRAWSRKISAADAFVFVTPQYNWGYPAPLKNALDHLYKEWAGKPAAIVSYGGHGGDKCARQLRQVLKGLKMRPIATRPAFRLMHERIKANTGAIDPAVEFAKHRKVLRKAFTELAAALRGNRLPAWLWPW